MTIPLSCWHVGPLYNQGANLIQNGTDAIISFGFDSAGYFLSPNYAGGVALDGHADYAGQTWGSVPTNLTQLIQTTPFQYVLSKSELKRIYFKTWTFANSIFDTWTDHIYDTQITSEYNEIKSLAIYLLQNTSGKDFFIQTSESDLSYLAGIDLVAPIPSTRAQRAVAFFDARIRAIRDARVEAGVSTSRVFSAIECNRVLDPGRRVHRDILPKLSPDFISLSIYEAIEGWFFNNFNQADSLVSIDTLIRKVVKSVREEYAKVHGLEIANNIPIYFGEWGWPEANTLFQNLDVAAFMDQLLQTGADLDIKSANFWQLWCNDLGPAGGVAVGVITDQCIQKSDNSFTVQGAHILTLL